MAVALFGMNVASAQYSDTLPSIEFTLFTSGDVSHALAAGDDISNKCVEVKDAAGDTSAISSVGTQFVYRIDTSGQIYRNGVTLGSPNPNFLSAFNSGVFYRLYTRNENNIYGNAVNLTE